MPVARGACWGKRWRAFGNVKRSFAPQFDR
jgi:hypothetical protein